MSMPNVSVKYINSNERQKHHARLALFDDGEITCWAIFRQFQV